jgi:hypothetical protein
MPKRKDQPNGNGAADDQRKPHEYYAECMAKALARIAYPALKGVSEQECEEIGEGFGYLVGTARRVRELEVRVAELESAPLKYMGTWKQGAAYGRGALVTFDGSIFHANREYPGKPATPNSGWQLAVKRGKDAPR